MIINAFGNPQCLICYQTFKENNLFVCKRHFNCFHSETSKLNENEKLFESNKQLFVEKSKEWLINLETNKPRSTNTKLKRDLSSLISLNIVKQGRPFSDGKFVANILKEVFEKLNYNTTLIKSLPLSRFTLVRRTMQMGEYVESVIRQTLQNCVFFLFAWTKAQTLMICANYLFAFVVLMQNQMFLKQCFPLKRFTEM